LQSLVGWRHCGSSVTRRERRCARRARRWCVRGCALSASG
jgi:hypothetical protein